MARRFRTLKSQLRLLLSKFNMELVVYAVGHNYLVMLVKDRNQHYEWGYYHEGVSHKSKQEFLRETEKNLEMVRDGTNTTLFKYKRVGDFLSYIDGLNLAAHNPQGPVGTVNYIQTLCKQIREDMK